MEIKYHISPETGNPNRCYADKRPCPLGIVEHYATKKEARAAFSKAKGGSFDEPARKEQSQTLPDLPELNEKPAKREYAYNATGVRKSLADNLRDANLTPDERYSVEYDSFLKKPSKENYDALIQASHANYIAEDDHLRKVLRDSVPAMKKSGGLSPDPAKAEMLAARASREAAYDAKYPRASRESQDFSPAPYSGQLVEGMSDLGIFRNREAGTMFSVEDAKTSPNGYRMVIESTSGGWFASTDAGVRLRGPFKSPEDAMECARYSPQLGGPHYMD